MAASSPTAVRSYHPSHEHRAVSGVTQQKAPLRWPLVYATIPFMPQPARELTLPKTGTYQTRFVKGGPYVPVRITIVADDGDSDGWRMEAIVDGKQLNYAYGKEEIEAEALIWLMGGRAKDERTPAERLLMSILLAAEIDEAEYERLLELRRTMPSWHPCHRPYEKIDLSKLPPLGRVRREL